MIVVFPFSVADQDLALKNVQWMNELGGCKGHDCLLIYDFRCNEKLTEQILAELKKCFSNGSTLKAEAEIDGWPQGANYFMRLAACKLQNSKYPYFLWMEPDAIPLKEGWLDAIDHEFKTVAMPMKKAFMGDRVEVENIPLHMSGVGIYSNPLHASAGEAYRAYDEAWDMAGRHQIVPRAHFTKLIVHNWKHEPIDSHSKLENLRSQHAGMVIFHSDKSGSMIDILRDEDFSRAGKQLQNPTPLEPIKDREEPRSPCPTNFSGDLRAGVEAPKLDSVGSTPTRREPDFTCDIFIRTYPGDYSWLAYCVFSIHKFCTGFRKIWVVSPEAQPSTVKGVEWKVMNEESEDHYLSQQVHKLYADVITDYQADCILHVDSDNVFQKPTTPLDFMTAGKVDWFHTPYHKDPEANWKCWKKTTEKFMGEQVENEFMRRFPIMIPRWLYPRVREFCNIKHGVILSEYIRQQPLREFSEYNALGAYAWKFHHDKFNWIDTETVTLPKPFARQFWSWGGITPEVEKEIQTILSGVVESRHELLQETGRRDGRVKDQATSPDVVAGAKPAPSVAETGERKAGAQDPASSAPPAQFNFNRGIEPGENPGDREPSAEGGRGSLNTPKESPGDGVSAASPDAPPRPGIKELPNGIWVIEDDSHISKWIEQQGRLDHDQNLLPFILPEIGESDVVVDAGAFVGDHTVAYMKAACHGVVYAFEPNPIAFRCLLHNVQSVKGSEYRVVFFDRGLSDVEGRAGFYFTENNHGGCYLKDEGGVGGVNVVRLDTFGLNPNFVKLDVEGFELKALQGMERTIRRCHPKLVIEINRTALERQDADPKDIFRFLDNHGYELKILQENCSYDSPMYDVLAIHKPIEIAPQYNNGFDVARRVRELRKYADQSRGNSVRVGQQLSKAGFK